MKAIIIVVLLAASFGVYGQSDTISDPWAWWDGKQTLLEIPAHVVAQPPSSAFEWLAPALSAVYAKEVKGLKIIHRRRRVLLFIWTPKTGRK